MSVQTTQATSKIWKLIQLIGVLAIIVSVFLIMIGIDQEMPVQTVGGVLVLLAGISGWIVGRLGAWWFHA